MGSFGKTALPQGFRTRVEHPGYWGTSTAFRKRFGYEKASIFRGRKTVAPRYFAVRSNVSAATGCLANSQCGGFVRLR